MSLFSIGSAGAPDYWFQEPGADGIKDRRFPLPAILPTLGGG